MLEMLPYPSGSLHMGHVLNYTLGDVITHFKRRNGFTVLRPMGFDSFGLPAENAAIKEGGHPREITERNIEAIRSQMRRLGWAIDWQREVVGARADVLPLDAVAVPAALRARARLPQGGAGQLVPERPDRARERARRRRPLRRCGSDRRDAEHRAVVLQDHRLRRRAARRPGDDRLARAHEEDPAQLHRPLRGRRGPVPRRGARPRHRRLHDAPDTLFGATFFVVAPESPARRRAGRAATEDDVLRYARIAAARADRGARDAREDRRVHRAVRDEPGERRAAPDLGRRLRADGVRHGRDHGRARARRARPRVRARRTTCRSRRR